MIRIYETSNSLSRGRLSGLETSCKSSEGSAFLFPHVEPELSPVPEDDVVLGHLMCPRSRFTSDILTGLIINSSAPSARHLCENENITIPSQSCTVKEKTSFQDISASIEHKQEI